MITTRTAGALEQDQVRVRRYTPKPVPTLWQVNLGASVTNDPITSELEGTHYPRSTASMLALSKIKAGKLKLEDVEIDLAVGDLISASGDRPLYTCFAVKTASITILCISSTPTSAFMKMQN